MSLSIHKGHSIRQDAAAAVAEISAAISQPDMSAVILFVSSAFDARLLGREVGRAFTVPVIACTTSGEISPLGYPDHSIAAVSIASPRVEVQVDFIPNVQGFSHEQANQLRLNIFARLQALREKTPATKAFACC